MEIPKSKKGYTVDMDSIDKIVKSTYELLIQIDKTTEESTDSEVRGAFILWGIARGHLDSLRQLDVIQREEYRYLSSQHLISGERLEELDKKRRGIEE